jgi:hypothetical protein
MRSRPFLEASIPMSLRKGGTYGGGRARTDSGPAGESPGTSAPGGRPYGWGEASPHSFGVFPEPLAAFPGWVKPSPRSGGRPYGWGEASPHSFGVFPEPLAAFPGWVKPSPRPGGRPYGWGEASSHSFGVFPEPLAAGDNVTMGASLGPDPRISRQIPRHRDDVGFRGTREGDNVTMGASLGPDPRISRQIPRHRNDVASVGRGNQPPAGRRKGERSEDRQEHGSQEPPLLREELLPVREAPDHPEDGPSVDEDADEPGQMMKAEIHITPIRKTSGLRLERRKLLHNRSPGPYLLSLNERSTMVQLTS